MKARHAPCIFVAASCATCSTLPAEAGRGSAHPEAVALTPVSSSGLITGPLAHLPSARHLHVTATG